MVPTMLGFNDIKKGKLVVLDGEPFRVMSADFLRKQQRRPVMRTTLKSLISGNTKEHSFQQSDKVEEADVRRRPSQFLFRDDSSVTFMDQETYEQHQVAADTMDGADAFLVEGQLTDVMLFNSQPITAELPIKVERKVTEAPPGVKGDTASNATKDVVIEGGARIKTPLFVSEGDTIRIDTRTGSYVERVQ